jgi:alkylation response protein AidB-like acyl-CoA dehydrogenase
MTVVPFIESDEQAMLREAVREIAARYGHAYYLEVSRSGRPATELWEELGHYGYVGVNIPEDYGGGGAGIGELAIVCEELAAAGTPSFLIIVSSAICAELLISHGSEGQKREWLPRMATGEAKMAFAVTEPDAGTNTHRLSTTAERDGMSTACAARRSMPRPSMRLTESSWWPGRPRTSARAAAGSPCSWSTPARRA